MIRANRSRMFFAGLFSSQLPLIVLAVLYIMGVVNSLGKNAKDEQNSAIEKNYQYQESDWIEPAISLVDCMDIKDEITSPFYFNPDDFPDITPTVCLYSGQQPDIRCRQAEKSALFLRPPPVIS